MLAQGTLIVKSGPEGLTNENIVVWEPWIRKIAMKQGVRLHELDDFVQDVYLAFITGGYEDIYDPNVSKPTTFLHSFVSLRAMGSRDSKNREANRHTDKEIGDEWEGDDGRSDVVILKDQTNYYEKAEYQAELGQVLSELESSCPVLEVVYQVVERKGISHTYRVERSLYTLAKLMLEEHTVREIAAIFNRSTGTVASMMKDLREHPVIVRSVLKITDIDDTDKVH